MSVRRRPCIAVCCVFLWSSVASADDEFAPSLVLGARIGVAFPTGELGSRAPIRAVGTSTSSAIEVDRYAGLGWTFEANAGVHVSPAWTLYGLWEFGSFSRGTSNASAKESPSMNTVGVGANANTAPSARVGLLLDGALGYRWFTAPHGEAPVFAGQPVPSADGAETAARGPAVRFGIGAAIRVTTTYRIDVLGQVTVVRFRVNDVDAEPGTGVTYGLAAGSRWDL